MGDFLQEASAAALSDRTGDSADGTPRDHRGSNSRGGAAQALLDVPKLDGGFASGNTNRSRKQGLDGAVGRWR